MPGKLIHRLVLNDSDLYLITTYSEAVKWLWWIRIWWSWNYRRGARVSYDEPIHCNCNRDHILQRWRQRHSRGYSVQANLCWWIIFMWHSS
jgi:hypothetical protein